MAQTFIPVYGSITSKDEPRRLPYTAIPSLCWYKYLHHHAVRFHYYKHFLPSGVRVFHLAERNSYIITIRSVSNDIWRLCWAMSYTQTCGYVDAKEHAVSRVGPVFLSDERATIFFICWSVDYPPPPSSTTHTGEGRRTTQPRSWLLLSLRNCLGTMDLTIH